MTREQIKKGESDTLEAERYAVQDLSLLALNRTFDEVV